MSESDTTSFYREPPRRELPGWIVAAAVVVGAHVGLGLYLLTHRPPEPPVDETQAVLVDLQPPADDAHVAPVQPDKPEAPAPEAQSPQG